MARHRVLILGGGPSDCAFRIRDYASRTTIIESDRLIVRSTETHWSEVTRYGELPDLEVVIDDPHHYLKTAAERFDLIINHAGPLNDLGATLLHSREFYELVGSRLGAGGVFVESTRGRPVPASESAPAEVATLSRRSRSPRASEPVTVPLSIALLPMRDGSRASRPVTTSRSSLRPRAPSVPLPVRSVPRPDPGAMRARSR